MKYWLLTTEYPPRFGGGIGTYCYQWSSILKQNGVEITVFVLNKQEKKFRELIHDDIRRIEFSPYLKDTSAFLGYETMVSASFDEIVKLYIEKEGPPDWLEAQEYQGIAYFLLQKKHLGESRYKDLKILITCHCPSFITFEHNHVNTYQLPYFWIGEMERFCIRAADLCIFPSKYLANDILSRHPQFINKYYILHNPYFPARDNLPYDLTGSNIIVIGKLSPAKGILRTLRVFEKLWQGGYTYKLRLIGDKNYFYHASDTTMGEYLKKRYSSYLKSGLLTISGALDPEKLKKEILQAKIVLVPSTVENFPYTVVESMGAGSVVLASDQGGQNEIIRDGYNGFLFDDNSTSSLEEKIHAIHKLKGDEIRQIKREAIKTIEQYCDPQTYFRKKMELLNQFQPVEKNDFPFISSFSDEKMMRGGVEEENSLLSVVIPYYNMGKYINETVLSIDRSGYQNKEIIIINDGSTDSESINILKALNSRGDIRIVDQQNLGLSAARNRGARESGGKYLAFLDADDKVEEHYYEKAINILKTKTNVHFVGCWVQYFDGSNRRWPAFIPAPPFLLYHNMINSSSLVYKKESFLKSGLNDPQFLYGMEDYDSVINLVKNGYHGVVIPEFLFYYRVRKNSMSRGFNKSNRLYLYQLLAEKHKAFYATFAAELFGLLNANGPGIFIDNPSLDYHLAGKIPFAGNLSKKLIYLVKKSGFTRRLAFKIHRLFNNRS